ncbi:Ig-like domain-containing protein [Cellulomonas sp. Root137]|uniref:Ig-like domain-containing protein n=1 Tax=Cellulomonas sp. Root137 TaxID=1736459 RepID=UPI0006F7509D|nr:Ig-like domain-containing protein [Cellulomonas sp. Root137]KQY47509.1 hypothetical protein ASD18_09350 [Cellulomonas sp. Root137]
MQLSLRRATAFVAVNVLAVGLLSAVGVAPAAAVAPTDPPVLTAPADGPGNPVLAWDAVPGATTYRVEVSTSSTFATAGRIYLTDTYALHATPPTDLPLGTIYWRVAALTGADLGPWASDEFTKTSATAPSAVSPADLASLAYPDETPTLRWSVLTGVKGYEVELDDEDGFVAAQSFSTANTSLALTTPLTLGKSWYWRVRGVSATTGVTTAWSTPRSFTVVWGDALGQPTLLGAGEVNEQFNEIQDIKFTWTPVRGAKAYLLQVSPNGDFANNIKDSVVVRGTQYSPAATYVAGGYYWRVQAIASATGATGQAGPWSAVGQFQRGWSDKPVPLRPIGGAEVSASSFRLAWDGVAHAAYYEVSISTDPNFSSGVTTCQTLHTSLTPHAVTTTPKPSATVGADCTFEPNPGAVYYWRVRAMDTPPSTTTPVQGVYSNRESFTFDQAVVRPISPVNNVTVTAPVLSWTPLAGYHRYQVTLIKDGVGSQKTVGTTSATTWSPTNVNDTNLGAGTYEWWVQGVSADGAMTPVAGSSGRGRFVVTDPTTTSPSIGTLAVATPPLLQDSPSMTWTPVTDAKYYRVYYAPAASNTFQELTKSQEKLPQAAYTYTEALSAGGWRWFVRAFNKDDGQIAQSGVATFTVTESPFVTYVAPANGSSQPDVPELRWAPSPDADSYTVWLATDKNFTNVVRKYSTHFTSITPRESLPDNTALQSYYWYVQVCRSDVTCGPGPQAAYEANEANISAFRKVSPAPVLDPTPVPVVDQVAFSWADYFPAGLPQGSTAPGAKAYRIDVASDASFATMVDTATVDQPFYAPWAKTYPDGTYYWRVQALDASSQVLTSSVPATFTKSSSAPVTRPVTVVNGLPSLSWTALSYAGTYTVELYRGTDSTYPLANRIRTDITAYAAFTPDKSLGLGSYTWRVRKNDIGGFAGQWSSGDGFTVGASVPALLAPDDAARPTSNDVVFRWSPVTGASAYRFEVSTAANFATMLESPKTVTTSWASPKYFVDGTPYFWRVVALDGADNAIGTSAVRTFTKNEVTVTLTSSANPAASRQSVTLGATVVRSGKLPTGKVTFYDGATKLGESTLSSGVATFATTTLGVGTHQLTAVWVGDASSAATTSDPLEQTITPAGAAYTPVTPTRAMSFESVPGGQTYTLQLEGAPVGATAVALNVTVANPSSNTYVSACPGGTSTTDCKKSSNVNPYAGRNTPNMVIVKLGADDTVTFYNDAGVVQLIADVQGWFVEGGTGGATYAPVAPTRAMSFQSIGAGQMYTLTLPNVPAGATAVALNVTAANPTSNTYVSACPGGTGLTICKKSSSLNPYAGANTPNMVIVKLGTGGKVSFYNDAGTVQLIADVQGWFVDGTADASYLPTEPTRAMAFQSVAAGKTYTLTLPDAPAGATAVVFNVTAANSTANTYVSACPGGTVVTDCKKASNLNPYAGRNIANLVIVKLGTGNKVTFYNDSGTSQLIADVQGWYVQ